MLRSTGIWLAFLLSFLLSACGNEGSWFGGQRANIAGAAAVLDADRIEPIRVEELIATLDSALLPTGAVASPAAFTPRTIDRAIVDFEMRAANQPKVWRQVRDTLQDRLLMASQSRCGFYEEFLKRFQSDSSSLFGSLATMLGGAGAIVTGVGGARALSGAAGIASGVGAELQKDLFSGVTSTVIVPGIEKRRATILTSIIANRCQAPNRYTIGLALTQALQFHAACAMDVGIEEGANAVKQASNPGAAGLASFISMGGQINQAQSVRLSIDKSRRGGAAASGTTVIGSVTTDAPVDSMLKSLTDLTIQACPASTNAAGG